MTVKYFYLAILSFLVGIAFATLVSVNLPTLSFVFSLALVCFLFWYRSKFFIEITGWLVVAIILTSFTLGALRTEFAESRFGHSILAEQVGEKISLSGIVVIDPSTSVSLSVIF